MSYNACGRKKVYYRRSRAITAIHDAYRLYGQHMHYYECQYCGWFHLSRFDHKRKEYTIRSIGLTFYQ